MTKNMNHAECQHPTTKAARAKCRAMHKQIEAHDVETRREIRDAYFAGVEAEELLGMMAKAGIPADPDLDIEYIIAAL
jgi:pyrrolidone-carboxylate peptidase